MVFDWVTGANVWERDGLLDEIFPTSFIRGVLLMALSINTDPKKGHQRSPTLSNRLGVVMVR